MENIKSLPQLMDHFKDEQTCIKHYEMMRWHGQPICPHCNAEKPYVTNRGYKCSNSRCYKKFTVKVGTIFENSKIPFRIWFVAIYLCGAHKKGISSVQLATDLGITQKTAWFVLHRVREMLKQQAPEMVGQNKIVETDETHIGGREKNRHKGKKLASPETGLANDGSKYNKKKTVIGIIERGGKVVLKFVPDRSESSLVPVIDKYVVAGSRIMTDEHTSYHKLNLKYEHETVNHSIKLYVDGDKHTNTIENFWSGLKRGIYGIYHQVSDKHMDRYLNEFAARFNARHNSPFKNFNEFLSKSEGGILYKNLILD